jgi:hypothetical protein
MKNKTDYQIDVSCAAEIGRGSDPERLRKAIVQGSQKLLQSGWQQTKPFTIS